MTLLVLLGGTRSGKSALAVRLAQERGAEVWFIATGEPGDEEMAARIEAHRSSRPPNWHVLEEPRDLEAAFEAVPPAATVVLDCLTLWVSNVLEGSAPGAIAQRASSLAARARTRPGLTIAVSSEVGMGLVPPNPLARAYADRLGEVNAAWADAADEVRLVVAGRSLRLERASPGPRGGARE